MTTTRTALATALVLTLAGPASAQHAGHGTTPAPSPAAKLPKPITMEELHRAGGVPPGWKFRIPQGDRKLGREIFAKLECNKCHEVTPDFPRTGGAGDVGPALTGMGAHHPAEYFAQSIVDPNAVILAGPGYVGPDGRSIMPDFRDSLTFSELVDLVAYIKSLDATGGDGAPHHQHHRGAVAPTREREAGPYRVRVEYRGADDHGHADHHGHGAGGAAKGGGHLMVFIADTASGEPVPYLPVRAVIAGVSGAPRTVPLVPMVSSGGFHYGADVALPSGTTKITLSLGAATVKTMGGMAGRYAKPVTVSFDWSD
jgi:mono/diheme cytochrome c family protein